MHPDLVSALGRDHQTSLYGRRPAVRRPARRPRARSRQAVGWWLVHAGLRLATAGTSTATAVDSPGAALPPPPPFAAGRLTAGVPAPTVR